MELLKSRSSRVGRLQCSEITFADRNIVLTACLDFSESLTEGKGVPLRTHNLASTCISVKSISQRVEASRLMFCSDRFGL